MLGSLRSIIDQCEYRTGYNSSTYRTTWTRFIKEGIREFARRYPWPGLEANITLRCDGTPYLVFPPFVDSIVSLLDVESSSPIIRMGDLDRNVPYAKTQQTSGTPFYYDKEGIVAAVKMPSAGAWVAVHSTHNSDTAYCYMEGYAAGPNASTVTMTGLQYNHFAAAGFAVGTTNVTLGGIYGNNWIDIVSISKATITSGDYHFVDTKTGDTISYIPYWDTRAAFKRIRFVNAPAAGRLIDVKYRHKIRDLSEENDSPPPAVDLDFVVNFAIAQHYRAREQFTKGQVLDQKGLDLLQQRANFEENFDEPYSQIIPMVDTERYRD